MYDKKNQSVWTNNMKSMKLLLTETWLPSRNDHRKRHIRINHLLPRIEHMLYFLLLLLLLKGKPSPMLDHKEKSHYCSDSQPQDRVVFSLLQGDLVVLLQLLHHFPLARLHCDDIDYLPLHQSMVVVLVFSSRMQQHQPTHKQETMKKKMRIRVCLSVNKKPISHNSPPPAEKKT